MKKIAVEVKWAFIFIIMIILWMLIERLVGLHSTHIDQHYIYTNFIAIPAIIIYVLALLDKRKNYYSGTMTYKQGFVSGLIITVVVTIISPVSQVITLELITPDYFTNVIEYSVESGSLTRESAEEYFNLNSYMIQGLIGAMVMGIVTSAIVAIFTRKVKVS
jgi:uncharacterized membrane protein YvlD (DUF360 family)